MKYGQLIVDKKEQGLLLRSIANSHSIEDVSYAASLKKLKLELLTAKILESQKMPQDVIRFNSEITITTSGGSEQSFQIVIPEKSDITNRKISILSPMALALFGYAQGDILEWVFPSGVKDIAIVDVKQPNNL